MANDGLHVSTGSVMPAKASALITPTAATSHSDATILIPDIDADMPICASATDNCLADVYQPNSAATGEFLRQPSPAKA